MKRIWMGLIVLSLFSAGPAAAADRKPAPDFEVTDLSGSPLKLSAFQGSVILLDFWATWCPPCRAEIPHFKQLYAGYKGKGLQVIGLSVGEKPDVVRSFAKANGITYPVGMSSDSIEQAYGGIRGIPTTFLIDKQGRIAGQFTGYQEKQVFEQEIRALLAE